MYLRIDPLFGRILEQFVEHSCGVLAPRRVHFWSGVHNSSQEVRFYLCRLFLADFMSCSLHLSAASWLHEG